MKKNRIYLIIIIVFVLCSLLTVIFFYSRKTENEGNEIVNNIIQEDSNYNMEDFNYNNTSSSIDKQASQSSLGVKGLDVYDDDLFEENDPIKEDNLIFENINDSFSYFLVKYCLSNFYSSKENAFNSLDYKERNYDISNFYSGNKSYCIDKIYKATIKPSKSIYYVYYRIENEPNSVVNKQIIIKVDTKNASFYVYPYEYLKSINYTDLKDGSKVSLDIVDESDIEKTKYNNFNQTKIKKDEYSCIEELFERFEFDVKYDLNNLYNLLDEEYKNIRFNNDFNNFLSYMNNMKEIYTQDIIKGYQKYELNIYTQYIIICTNNDHFVINMKDLMNYTIQFDNYTTSLPIYSKIYQSNFPKVRAKYCIDRVRKAINDKNYEFVYSKLNPVQKSNSYPDYNEFIRFIQVYFYDKNIFEYGDVVQISDYVYRYSVNIKDENNSDSLERTMNMTITLKDDEDFTISITV